MFTWCWLPEIQLYLVTTQNVVKFVRREIGEIVRYLVDKNTISPASQTVATARIATKICQGQAPTIIPYSECSRFHPNLFKLNQLNPAVAFYKSCSQYYTWTHRRMARISWETESPPGKFPIGHFPLPCSVRIRVRGDVSRVRVRVSRVSRVSIRVRVRVRFMVWVRVNVRES